MSKLPAMPWYIGDWRKDPAVQALEFFDRHVWFEILMLMWESERRGYLLLNGRPVSDDALARILGIPTERLTLSLSNILGYGVASVDPETGALVNRRMIRDEEIRQKRAIGGIKGGNPALLNHPSNLPADTKDKQKVNLRPENENENEIDDFSLNSEETSKVKTSLPANFSVTPKMSEWFETKRFEQFGGNPFSIDMGMQTEMFLNDARTHGRTHINWKRAWCNWMLRAEEYKQERAQKNTRGSNRNGHNNGNSKGQSVYSRLVR